MLEGLHEIDWARLHHAYGTAEDVPSCLERLASEDPETRADAEGELYSNICHQGTIYEATSYAVPFLRELLAQPSVPGKADLLMLLASLRTGTSQDARWMLATAREVDKGIPLYQILLSADEPPTRSFAAFTLSCCQKPEVAPALLAQLELEPEKSVTASILFALGDLKVSEASEQIPAYLADEDFGVQVAAAVAMATIARERTPEKAIELLAEALCDTKKTAPLEELPKVIDQLLPCILCDALTGLGPETAGSAATPIVEGLSRLKSHEIDEPLEALLGITFAKSPRPLTPEQLTAAQRAILLTIADLKQIWHPSYCSIREDQLSRYGLPGSRKELARFARAAH